MEMEINLQDYVSIVLRRWKLVLVVFLAATVVAVVASSLQPAVYEATVTLIEQSYEFWDVPRLAPLDRIVVKLYPTLARTEAVEDRVAEALESSLSPAERIPGALLSMVTVREDRDNEALFQIKAQANDSDKAVQIANSWAEQYLQLVGGLEADPSSQEAHWGSQLVEAAEQELESVEEELTTFRQETGLGLAWDLGGDEAFIVFGARGLELERKLLLLAEHRHAQDKLLLLLQRARQARQDGAGIEDLPLQLLNAPVIVDRGQLSIELVREQEDLDSLIALLQTEEELISEVVDELAPEVQQMQEELAEDKLQLERLSRARGIAEGAYRALTNEVQEAQLYQSRTQILSRATRSKLVGPNRRLNIMLGAALGLAGGVLAAFAAHYFQRIRKRA
jgi:uncharacterized protein involved in exopolysaccharide biosynthesis